MKSIIIMKITKAKLKQIIKEEIESITNEARAPRFQDLRVIALA